jgi:hypothetical protein
MAKNVSGFMRLPEPVLTEIGRVIGAWSHIEQQFDMIYLGAVVMEERGRGPLSDPRVKMMGTGFERRVRELREHLTSQAYGQANAQRWDRALSQLISLRRKRDILAHGRLSLSTTMEGDALRVADDAVSIVFKSWRNAKPHMTARVKLQDLKRTFERMERLFWDLHDLGFLRPIPRRDEPPP